MTDELDKKLNEHYAGKVVRKDLTKLIKEGMNVPSYVLEYLLGMYCATDDEEDIVSGTAMVKQILADNYIKMYDKLLGGGIWCIITLAYEFDENSKESPFKILSLKLVQMPATDINEYIEARKHFSKEEWMQVLLRSMGMEPTNLSPIAQQHLIARIIPTR